MIINSVRIVVWGAMQSVKLLSLHKGAEKIWIAFTPNMDLSSSFMVSIK